MDDSYGDGLSMGMYNLVFVVSILYLHDTCAYGGMSSVQAE